MQDERAKFQKQVRKCAQELKRLLPELAASSLAVHSL